MEVCRRRQGIIDTARCSDAPAVSDGGMRCALWRWAHHSAAVLVRSLPLLTQLAMCSWTEVLRIR